jgi:hypothetical protein
MARAFNVNLSSINRRINLLEGICPEAITLLQDKQFTPDVTRILRNMKAARQVGTVELMIASNTITVADGGHQPGCTARCNTSDAH